MSETWAPVPEGSDFPFENLPFGIFRPRDEEPRVGVRIGDHVVDLVAAGIDLDLTARSSLNLLMASGRGGALRSRVAELLTGPERFDALLPLDEVFVLMPVDVVDYIDFYSSIHHASNMGTMFRPGPEPLLPNWRQLPVAYHGRARTVVPSDTPVVRPEGLIQDGEGPAQPGADPDARHRAGGRLLRRRPAGVQNRARPRRPSHLRRRAAQRLVGPGHPGVREPATRPAPGEELRHDDLAVGRHASTPFGRSSSSRPCRTPSRTRTCAPPCPGGSTSTSASSSTASRSRRRTSGRCTGRSPSSSPTSPSTGRRRAPATLRVGDGERADARRAGQPHRAHLARRRAAHACRRIDAHVPRGRRHGDVARLVRWR